ncbi:uncharacterized protein PADG_12387 [Paracoccidioides brasiliensis Pb18]|uniref:Major facilitator superfamily (MFS) profile domain-containing protein n=1 Tax=Paracoccidioides brasiliensis (strain Pb18) TaxID=502780 RepID=A0A0A0HQL5_PARBD|nr:uncharacterized protein PADG_12387 [Paracoccidioides brasiliensis Pb18]KGM91529.1 hypothetical protein PADG_12387 [Paracoccidioides brasiliensis Pb18]
MVKPVSDGDGGETRSVDQTLRPSFPVDTHKGLVDIEKRPCLPSEDVDCTPTCDTSETDGEVSDLNKVDWDGPDDPMNPYNWPMTKKTSIVLNIALITFLTPLGSSMFAPGTMDVMREFKSSNQELASFVVSVYLRLIKETGNLNLKSVLDTGKTTKELFLFSIVRPTKMLFMSPIVFLISLFTAVIYGYIYLLFTTFTSVFERQYHFSKGITGLAFLGIGVGSMLGLVVIGTTSDHILQILAKKNNGELKPEYRIPLMIPGGICIPVGLFWYGWTAEKGMHYIVPIVGTGFVGVGMILIFMTGSTYLVDAFTKHSASAMAANTVLRSLGGAVLPLCGLKMYRVLGLGWGNSLLGFIALAMVPIPWFFFKYGERVRTSKRFRVIF